MAGSSFASSSPPSTSNSDSTYSSVFESEPSTPTSPSSPGDDTLVVPSNAPVGLNFWVDPAASEEERLILYSQAVYEYTRQLWIESRRQAELQHARKKQRETSRAMDKLANSSSHTRFHLRHASSSTPSVRRISAS